MADHVVAETTDVPEGERLVVELEGREIGVFNVDGEYYAYTNWCAHQAGPCCEGPITGTSKARFDAESLEVELSWVKEGEILNCPWHGWEYDVTNGECLSRAGISLVSHPVSVEDGQLVVSL
jgi:nitrite reductase/ring-hydroxylating ferredoxin subunit